MRPKLNVICKDDNCVLTYWGGEKGWVDLLDNAKRYNDRDKEELSELVKTLKLLQSPTTNYLIFPHCLSKPQYIKIQGKLYDKDDVISLTFERSSFTSPKFYILIKSRLIEDKRFYFETAKEGLDVYNKLTQELNEWNTVT